MKIDPEPVWKYFEQISKIPRCSKNEDKICNYILSLAKENDLESHKDEAGNIVLRKPSTVESDSSPVVLQSHLDMVCEKNENSDHDFSTDPIQIKREGNWITAKGTTLGADNGIGVATSLAIATSNEIEHGPLEFLFTVDEETGLNGAFNLQTDFLEGRKLINLDSEDFGVFTIGCAGGGNSEISLPVNTENFKVKDLIKISISGLRGGHSGVDIDKGRANSIKLLGRILRILNQKMDDVLIKDLNGGDKHNAIPREASTTVMVNNNSDAIEVIEDAFDTIKKEYKNVEENMEIRIETLGEAKNNIKLLDKNSTRKTIRLILSLPNGVLSMSQEIEDLVKTSTNLATVSMKGEKVEVTMSTRSSVDSELESTRDRIRVIAESFNAQVKEDKAYPGWDPEPDSDLLETVKNAYMDIFEEEPKIEAIHAGLETGIIGEKFEDMEMVSIGPEIRNPHSPDEKVEINTVEKFWKHLMQILETVA